MFGDKMTQGIWFILYHRAVNYWTYFTSFNSGYLIFALKLHDILYQYNKFNFSYQLFHQYR